MGTPAQSQGSEVTNIKDVPELVELWKTISPFMREIDQQAREEEVSENVISIYPGALYLSRSGNLWGRSNSWGEFQLVSYKRAIEIGRMSSWPNLPKRIKEVVQFHLNEKIEAASRKMVKLAKVLGTVENLQ